jgi:prepilin-type N-terminal cleavage/methylation domain-containing protein
MKKILNSKAGFTLAELLVVISIIALLTSVVLANLMKNREKAKVTKSIEFSQTTYQSLAAYAVGVWRFEDNKADDYSGYGNSGAIYGGASFVKGVMGFGLSLDGSSGYVDAGKSSSINMESNDDFTIEVWAKSNTFSSGGGVISKGSWDDIGYFISYAYSPNCIFFALNDAEGYANKELNTNLCGGFDWSHIVGVKRGNSMEVWVNAKKVNELKDIQPAPGSLNNSASLTIGKSTNGYYFNGSIDEARIYKQALSTSQIQRNYVEGLTRHKDLTLN